MSARRIAPFLVCLAATWAVWQWLWQALTGRGADPWGALSLGLAAALVLSRLRPSVPWHASAGWLAVAAAGLAGYAGLWNWAPRLVAAGFAFLGLGATLMFALPPEQRRRSLSLPALVVLGLPIGPSVDYVAGYPLRLVSGELAALALRAGGLQAVAAGATLKIDGVPVFLDPACSGVHMLWVAVLGALALGALHGARAGRLGVLLVGAVVLAVAANAWRSAALALMEVHHRGGMPDWMHEAVGLAAFGAVMFVLSRASTWRHACVS